MCNMEARSDRKNGNTDWVISPPDEIHPLLTGEGALDVAELFAPKPAEVRRMLLALRKRLRWSQPFAAMVLGVTPSAIAKWESCDRQANGAAAKLIFLLYSELIEPGKIRNVWDLALWGGIPCRGSALQLAAVSGTYFIPNGIVELWLKTLEGELALISHDSAEPV